jgi:hypothetical protein
VCSEFDACAVSNKISIHCNAFVIVCSVFATSVNMISDVKYAMLTGCKTNNLYKKPTRHQHFTLLITVFTTLLPVDGIEKYGGPLSWIPVNRGFQIIQCQMYHILLYLLSLVNLLQSLLVIVTILGTNACAIV